MTVVDPEKERIKQAVKEALGEKAIADLGTQMTSLSIQMAEGFAGFKSIQAEANTRLRVLEDWKLKAEARIGTIAAIVSFLISVAFLVANKYL